jgi:hypothetical protein
MIHRYNDVKNLTSDAALSNHCFLTYLLFAAGVLIQICVLVSTYITHGLRLTALIASLLSTSYPYIDVILLDTDVKHNSTQWMLDTANAFNRRSNDPKQRETVHLSQYTQRYIRNRFPEVTAPDYG